MDREQVLQWARDAGLGYISANGNYVAAYRHSKEHVAEFARLVRNAALEEAAAIGDAYLGGSIIGDAIRALIEKEPQP